MKGVTGHLFEEEAFGCVRSAARANGEYKPYRQALEEVKANQPWDPTDPNVRFANDLHALVALVLGLIDWAELRIYTAIGSDLDRWHGIDAFFEFGGARVTLDVTLNRHKLDYGYKADFIVGEEAVENASVRQERAQEIAHELRQREAAATQPRRRPR